jgi:hypothetical protein
MLAQGAQGGGDLNEAATGREAGDVARREGQASQVPADVGDAEAGPEGREGGGVVGAVSHVGPPTEGGARVLSEGAPQEGDGSRGLVGGIEAQVQVDARQEGASPSLLGLPTGGAHDLRRDELVLADVEGAVAQAAGRVVGEPELRVLAEQILAECREGEATRSPHLGRNGVLDVHPSRTFEGAYRDQGDRSVLGDRSIDRPLSRHHLGPARRAARAGDEPQTCLPQPEEGSVGLLVELALVEDGVVEVEEQPSKTASLFGSKLGQRSQRLSTWASTLLR